MNWIEVEFQGKKLRVPALKYQGRLWFHWQGETHVAELSGGRAKSGEKASVRPGVISAPMPGKITRVSVKKGDGATRGQALVVMEAMKMEYTLEADREGCVEEVSVKPGDQVSLGQVLVRLGDK